ncbi:MAG: hypothetical protein Unbinned3806contig1000_38 [Prokaryotic dsDNA virus sp.]|nr:MAG: hypothetical protein Unbinned3806contig1000_38 [Prokaryotic dsDNA virus sp.]|tara:strand:- start:32189 stop:32368 length:180 start_codon:yes stop_codon:yes gene_type:complete
MNKDEVAEKKQELEGLLRQTQDQLKALSTQEQRVIGALALLQDIESGAEEKPPVKRAKK